MISEDTHMQEIKKVLCGLAIATLITGCAEVTADAVRCCIFVTVLLSRLSSPLSAKADAVI